jgi:hypothetical protein
MSTNTITIAKLRGADDFACWKRRIIALLQDKDYDTAIQYDLKNFDPIDVTIHLTNDPVKQRLDVKARGLIELNVDDTILPYLVTESSAHAYWVKLHSIYQRKSLSSIVYRMRNLFTCTQDGRRAQECQHDRATCSRLARCRYLAPRPSHHGIDGVQS